MLFDDSDLYLEEILYLILLRLLRLYTNDQESLKILYLLLSFYVTYGGLRA